MTKTENWQFFKKLGMVDEKIFLELECSSKMALGISPLLQDLQYVFYTR